jgi:TolB-like protein/Flp pilus assembly protein TadD
MNSADHRFGVIAFGAFELDRRTGELRKHGVKQKLQPKPRLMLELLLEHAGEIVSFADVEAKLWPEEHVEFDRNVGIALCKLRKVLGDSATNPRFIETVQRQGFRFIAPLRQVGRAGTEKKMVAILPFDNISNDRSQDYFADGMTEDLITQVGRVNPTRMGVIARTSSMSYKTTRPPLRQIAADLGVEYIVEGSVRREGGRVRITAQLIQVSDQTHIWADTYDRSGKDALGIQAEVAEKIASALVVELLPEQRALMRRATKTNSEAHDLYLQGRHHWFRRIPEEIERALDCFERAVSADPQYALPYVGIADSYAVLGYYGDLPPSSAFSKARTSAQKAVELDGELAEAHSTLAFIAAHFDWKWSQADRSHRRALQLNPNYCSAHHWYGLGLMQVGRFREALQALRRAQELDPLSAPVHAHVGRVHYFARQYKTASSILREAVDMDPDYLPARYFLAMTLAAEGGHDEAVSLLQGVTRVGGEHPIVISGLASVLFRAGRHSEAEAEVARLHRLAKTRHVSSFFCAFALAASDQAERVMSSLEAALAERFAWLPTLRYEPAFDACHTQPAFLELAQRAQPEIETAAGTPS